MKKFFFAVISLFSFSSAIAIETYITFNPESCLSCVSGIYRICRVNEIKSVAIVTRQVYENDTAEMNKLYEFNKFPKVTLVFSDSLYKALSAKQYEAELIVWDKKKELYRRNIKQVVINDQLLALYATPQQTDSLCSPFIKRLAGIDIGNHYIVMFGEYRDYNIIDTKTGSEKLVRLTDDDIINLYKLLYGDNFDKRFPVIQEMITETPTYKPTIEDVREWDTDHLMVLGNIKDYYYNPAGDTVFTVNRPNVMKYKYNSGKIVGIYQLSGAPSMFDLWQFHIADSKYYGQGFNNSDELFQLLEFSLDDKGKILSLKRDTKVTQPTTYKQRGVSTLEEYNIRIKGNLLCFVYDDKITLLNSGKQITIPFKDYANSKWNAYEIRDLREDKDYYYIMYVHDKQFHVMRLGKANLIPKDAVVGNSSSINTTKMKFYTSGNKVIYQPKDSDCFIIKDIEF